MLSLTLGEEELFLALLSEEGKLFLGVFLVKVWASLIEGFPSTRFFRQVIRFRF